MEEDVRVKVKFVIVLEVLAQALVWDVLGILRQDVNTLSLSLLITGFHEHLEQIVPDNSVIGLPVLPLHLLIFLVPFNARLRKILREFDVLGLLHAYLKAFLNFSESHLEYGQFLSKENPNRILDMEYLLFDILGFRWNN